VRPNLRQGREAAFLLCGISNDHLSRLLHDFPVTEIAVDDAGILQDIDTVSDLARYDSKLASSNSPITTATMSSLDAA
jgi:hypothetical protein